MVSEVDDLGGEVRAYDKKAKELLTEAAGRVRLETTGDSQPWGQGGGRARFLRPGQYCGGEGEGTIPWHLRSYTVWGRLGRRERIPGLSQNVT